MIWLKVESLKYRGSEDKRTLMLIDGKRSYFFRMGLHEGTYRQLVIVAAGYTFLLMLEIY